LKTIVRVEEGTLESAREPFDVIAANISPSVIIELAGAMAAALKPGGVPACPAGRLIVGGFSEERTTEVAAALTAAGLVVERTLSDGDWRTHVARRG